MAERDEIRVAAFEFARRLRDASLRTALQNAGHRPAQDAPHNVIIALDSERLSTVLGRVAMTTSPSTIVAVRLPSERSGFGLLAFEPARIEPREDAGEDVHVGSHASIGMLYAYAKAAARPLTIHRSWFRVTKAA